MADAVKLGGAEAAPGAWVEGVESAEFRTLIAAKQRSIVPMDSARRRRGCAGRPCVPAQMYRVLRANAETLGYVQDYTVSALTELPSLLLGPDTIGQRSRAGGIIAKT
jgi:hypothetical protein